MVPHYDSNEPLVLDGRIRDWVLITVASVVFLSSIFRHFISKLTTSSRPPTTHGIQQINTLARARKLIQRSSLLPQTSFLQRKAYFCSSENGVLCLAKPEDAQSQPGLPGMGQMPMMDQSSMMDMMRNNLTMIVPQILLMSWVTFFFSGFLVLKLPFPLTQRFKAMLQRGVELASLDVSYVSSLSWYFLTFLGLRGIVSLVLGEVSAADDARMLQAQMGSAGGMAAPPGAPVADVVKVYTAEKENLELVSHSWELANIEERVLSSQ